MMYCFNFSRNQLWQYLISYNTFRNMNMCLLEVAMCEKCRSSHFQLERGVKKFENSYGGGGGKKILELGVTFAGGSVVHYMPCFISKKEWLLQFVSLLNAGNKLIADFKEKVRLFNEFFASKYTPNNKC